MWIVELCETTQKHAKPQYYFFHGFLVIERKNPKEKDTDVKWGKMIHLFSLISVD